jgi:hypothetical protein
VGPGAPTFEKSSGRHCCTVRLLTLCRTSPRCREVEAWDRGAVPLTLRDCQRVGGREDMGQGGGRIPHGVCVHSSHRSSAGAQ